MMKAQTRFWFLLLGALLAASGRANAAPRDYLIGVYLLIQHPEAGWTRYAEQCSKPYVLYVPSGWDPRPWRDPRPSFAFPTRNEWTAALRRVKAALDRHSNLGIPATGSRTKMLLIYAWNEFGKGGIVAPTRGENEMKLEAIRDVFLVTGK